MTILDANGTAILPTDLKADLATHHIEGYAREDPTQTHFDVPLFSHVEGNLYQGGCIGGVNLRGYFDHIFSLYPWERYNPGKQLKTFVEVELYDGPTVPDEAQLIQLATMINFCKAKGRTLVHCQAGLNRSGLLTGLSLVLDGMDPSAAIRLLRDSRCEQVLCNRKFFGWLANFSSQSASKTVKSKRSRSAATAAAAKTLPTQA